MQKLKSKVQAKPKRWLAVLLAAVVLAALLPVTMITAFAAPPQGLAAGATITVQPQGGVFPAGGDFTLSVEAEREAVAGGDLQYEWYSKADEENPIADDTSELTVSEPGTYYVLVWSAGANNSLKSAEAKVIMTLDIPFKKNVEQGGDMAPGAETFGFELFDFGTPVNYELDAEINAPGVGSFDGNITLTLESIDDFWGLTDGGFKVREVQGAKAGWDYAEEEYFVTMEVGEMLNPIFTFYKVTGDEISEEDIVEEMLFINTYTEDNALFSITVLDDGNGTGAASAATAAAGTVIKLTATPNAGFEFDYWSTPQNYPDIVNDEFVMPGEDVTVTAHFKPVVTEPTDTDPTEPDPTDTDPTDPEPTDTEPTEPDPTDPEPTEPDPTDRPTDRPTTAKPTEPTPQTGDNVNMMVWLLSGGAALLLFGVFTFSKKRKVQD